MTFSKATILADATGSEALEGLLGFFIMNLDAGEDPLDLIPLSPFDAGMDNSLSPSSKTWCFAPP